MKNNSVLITQIVGVAVLLLAMFGIDVSAEDQVKIIGGLSALGLVVTSVVDRIQKPKSEKTKP